MRIRLSVEGPEDEAALVERVRLLEKAEGHPAWYALVKLRDGRTLFGTYGADAEGCILLTNDWNLDNLPDLAHVARRHGWLASETRVALHPSKIHWLEFVPEGSPFFYSGARHE